MKKLMLIAAAAAAISAASAVAPANAFTIIKPGCCGGGYPGGGFHPHWGGGLSIGVGFDSGYSYGVGAPVIGSDCFYVRRKVPVPGVGLVSKRQLVCG